jgi:hypothetical protein
MWSEAAVNAVAFYVAGTGLDAARRQLKKPARRLKKRVRKAL